MTRKIKQIGAPILMFACFACGSSRKNAEDPSMPVKGQWINMATSLDSWHVYNKPGTVGKSWSLKDGVLHLDDSNKKDGKIVDGGNLVFNEEFQNFHLKLEWKISPGGNSGIIFLVNEIPELNEPYDSGPEMQVLDNEGHPDGKIIKHRAGDLYDLISCNKEMVKPVGEWNRAEIILLNNKLDFYLNGTNVVSTTLWNDQWDQMIGGSKFKGWPHFARYKSGKIVLQDHDNAVWYRNLMVKRL